VDLAQTLPTMEQLYKRAHYFFVNYQQMLDYPLVEREIKIVGDGKERPKLRFIGGIGMIDEDEGERVTKVAEDGKKNAIKTWKDNAVAIKEMAKEQEELSKEKNWEKKVFISIFRRRLIMPRKIFLPQILSESQKAK
jgi:hypothetical protein